jgi:hypothetical protein
MGFSYKILQKKSKPQSQLLMMAIYVMLITLLKCPSTNVLTGPLGSLAGGIPFKDEPTGQ